ncbi:hypothetical protein L917_08286, partial [Phytophthora nicotianae]
IFGVDPTGIVWNGAAFQAEISTRISNSPMHCPK